jgi:hypothetical protein
MSDEATNQTDGLPDKVKFKKAMPQFKFKRPLREDEVRRFTPEHVAAHLWQTNGNVSLAATLLKCERSTIYEYIERWPELGEIRKRARGDFADMCEGHLMLAARNGKPWAVMEGLRAHGRPLGYGDKLEITGADGGPIQHDVRQITVKFVMPEGVAPGWKPGQIVRT